MFTIGFRGCDFHEKDACGSAGSASLTGSGLSAGSSQAVPLLNATFCTLWKATKPRAVDVPALATPKRRFARASAPALFPFYCSSSLPGKIREQTEPFTLASQYTSPALRKARASGLKTLASKASWT